MLQGRHKIELGLLLFFIFVCFFTMHDLWKYWMTITISTGLIFLLDIMFSFSTFDYEPSYAHWKAKNDNPDY